MVSKTLPRAASAAPEAKPKARPVKVRATRVGYYGDQRRRIGDVFTIPSLEKPHFSSKWMELVDDKTPEHTTSAPEALKKWHEDQRAGKVLQKTDADRDVLGGNTDD